MTTRRIPEFRCRPIGRQIVLSLVTLALGAVSVGARADECPAVVVGTTADPTQRGVVATASYEARRTGAQSVTGDREIVKEAASSGRSLREVCRDAGIDEETVEAALDYRKMARPHGS